ncbi:MAG TPA: hypothetical protein VEI02_13300, partial [Planctomycetota bacterium]|nr:hypothetical protein [Planctomycetota bacterium]
MTYLRIAGVLVAFAALASAQRGGNDAPSSREATWPAPTADDLKKPCLIKWQRTWEDALALQKETGKPILLCINMDGEIASEHYAGIRYRSPEAAALYEPYICVIASTYRHAPQDYDEEGRRVPCPRFGTVTCGEHIAIEPILFEKYMEGRRIAPRHICIEPDGKESYDVFYAWDVDSVLKTVGDGGKGRPNVPLAKSDRPVTERVAGRDARDRDAVETAFLEGDAERRKALLEAATKAQGAASADLLRLALHGFDPDLAAKARDALAKADSENAVDLIAHALTLPTDPAQREAMIAALERLGARSPRAATLASAHRGLGGRSTAIDLTAWAEALRASAPAGTARSARGLYGWARELDAGVQASDAERRLAAKEATLASDDATAHFELAEALTAKALAPETSDEDLRALMVEAQTVVARAEKLGAYGWRLQSVGATAAWYAGEVDEARRRAESAFADL